MYMQSAQYYYSLPVMPVDRRVTAIISCLMGFPNDLPVFVSTSSYRETMRNTVSLSGNKKTAEATAQVDALVQKAHTLKYGTTDKLKQFSSNLLTNTNLLPVADKSLGTVTCVSAYRVTASGGIGTYPRVQSALVYIYNKKKAVEITVLHRLHKAGFCAFRRVT